MKFSHYLTYTAADFSTDPFFLEWRWFQTEETCLFWTSFLAQHPEKSEEVLLAVKIVEMLVEGNEVSFSPQDKESAVKKLTSRVYIHKKRKKITVYSLSTVVVFFLFFLLTYKNTGVINSESDKKKFADISEKEVQLIFSAGGKVSFKEDIQIKYDTTGNIVVQNELGEMLEKHESDETHIALNRLIVPKGKRSSLLLADGSKIWVNSGTTVEFPSVFENRDERKIKIEGEIYIEVEKDTQRPFLISTPDFEVAVLGTKFNISAYPEDPVQHVTVAEGMVSVVSEAKKQRNVVAQNQQLQIIDKMQSGVTHVDVYNFTSWKDGILRFESEPLKNILTRLSRYYDINLAYGDDIESIRCSGKLYLFDEWKMVLDNITKVSPVAYSENEDEIIFRYNAIK